jgi:NAD(P) transhydrogenase subunit beta
MDYTNLFYVIAAVLFILGIKRLSSPKTARTGNAIASIGMLIAILATVSSFGGLDFKLIAIGMIVGSILGATFALRVEMTQMPQMVAIFFVFDGGASALVATAEFFSKFGTSEQSTFLVTTIILSIFIGTLTLTGSFIAFGKLQGFISAA